MNQLKQPATIYKAALTSMVFILLLSLLLFTVIVTKIIFSRIEKSESELLNRSLTVAWEEYNRNFGRIEAMLTAVVLLTNGKDINAFSVYLEELVKKGYFDIWMVIGENKELMAANHSKEIITPGIEHFISESLKVKLPSFSSEIISIDSLKTDPLLFKKVTVENTSQGGKVEISPWAMLQLVSVPVDGIREAGSPGLLVAGIILNGDESIAESYSAKVPSSYLSIGAKGTRIACNIQTASATKYSFLGERQSSELLETVAKGERYTGKTMLHSEDIHYIVSDPIKNFAGEVIGALSVGVPSYKIVTIQRDVLLGVLFSLFICMGVAFVVAYYVSRKISSPIVNFANMVSDIAIAEESINKQQLRELKEKKMTSVEEINYLQHYFYLMAETVYNKKTEMDDIIAALASDRHKLQLLTTKLEEANRLLEKKVEERTRELRNAVVELSTHNKLKTQFLANMSHELRTPLHSIIGFSEMLYDEIYGALNPTQKEYIQIIIDSSKHLLQILSDILDLSRIERGETTLNIEQVNLKDLVESVVAINKPQISKKDQTLTIEIAPDIPLLEADPTRIKQVLYNLLSNANKFTPEGGLIKIKAFYCKEKEEVGVAVSDTGVGIQEDKKERVFDEFYQCEAIYENNIEGVGLGLPLSKKLVELHGGRIILDSIEGSGTKVIFFLPLNQKEVNHPG